MKAGGRYRGNDNCKSAGKIAYATFAIGWF
jgi:hypothetical protein